MGSSKRSAPVAGITGAKDRHKKAQRTLFDPKAPLPAGLVAKPTVPKLKHHTYFEIMENKDKKKKLEFKVTTDKKPPPGFEFVPMGNPSLTTACKELSREKDAMIFIVSNLKDAPAGSLSHQVHRIGHHIRESIVEEAREKFDVLPMRALLPVGEPEPIPTSQTQYNAQVDAAIRDLFPRIPNTDRQVIIDHAFDLSAKSRKAEKPVGLSADITLARRVQLAVLAHIRHSHTRYDELRKETSWINARRVVEALCLDILVKWRGDEETGRDQLDEILQEVVVISDSEDDAGDDADGSSSESDSSVEVISPPARPGHSLIGSDLGGQQQPTRHLSRRQTRPRLFGGALSLGHARTPGRKEQRGFKRYRAWQEAIQRSRAGEQSFDDNMMPKSVSHGPYHQSMGGSPQLPSALHPLPESRFGHIPEDLNRAQEPMTHAYEIFHPSRLALPERAPTEHTLQSRMESLPPERQPSPPILDRFKDLLVQSIEPDSPDIMQPSFVQPVRAKSREPRNYGYLREEPFLRPPHDASCDVRFASPQRSPRYRRFGEDQLDQAEFPGGFIQVSRHRSPDAHRPRPHHFVPPSAQVVEEPLLVTSRVRPRGPDHLVDSRPAKRLLLAPSPLAHPIEDFYMRDRGGFLEKVPLLRSEGSRSMPPDPGFIEIRRRPGPGPEADRVVSHEEGHRLRNEPGVEVLPISNSPARSSGGPLHGAPQTVHQPFEPSLLSPYHGPPQDTVPVHYSRPQRVFRYVRGTGPGAQHQPTHQPFDDYSTPYQETPPIQGWAHREIERPDYGYGQEDGRTTGCLSYTPSAGLDG